MDKKNKELWKEFNERLKEIAKSLKVPKKLDEVNQDYLEYLKELPKSKIYKQISYYAGGKIKKDLEDYKFICITNGIWQQYLFDKIFEKNPDYFVDISHVGRTKDLFRNERSIGNSNEDKASEKEDRLCRYLCQNSPKAFNSITLCDYQVPIKRTSEDKGCGKIDLVGARGEELVILEYKKLQNSEPLLRAVTEIITYFYQIGGGKDNAEVYRNDFNAKFGHDCKRVRMAVAVPMVMYKVAHKYAFELIEKYDIICYALEEGPDKGEDKITELSEEEIKIYRDESVQNMNFVYEHSEEIVNVLEQVSC